MKFFVQGRVTPERADVSFSPQVWASPGGDKITVSCQASQLSVFADLASTEGHIDAFIVAEQVAQAVVSALGFALGSGYAVELLQVANEAGEPMVFGVRPGNLEFDQPLLTFARASELVTRDIFFRLALQDYVRAMTETLDCAHYCYRSIEAIKSSFDAADAARGWAEMHAALDTSRTEIDEKIKLFADPVRHGNWSQFRSTNAAQRNGMLVLTQDVLRRYLDLKSPPSSA